MQLSRAFEDLVTELRQEHPWFRKVTIARLVARTVDHYRESYPDAPLEWLVSVVRREAGDQLRYVDGPEGTARRSA